ncbi:MAG TPA: FtsX-like permease family protein [Acidobacteriota bacterium]|nr:FtsX-like permease family protein [Acidobacteriota bacterium]
MKFLPFLLRNLFRNRRRTLLTATSIAVSLFLIATLLTVLSELNNPPTTPDSALRLVSRHKVSLGNLLPIAHAEKIRSVPGVTGLCGSLWFAGVYKDPSNFFPQFAITTDDLFEVYGDDLKMTEAEKEAFLKDRTGCIAGRKLADRFGWKLGEKIFLEGSIFPVEVELTLRGIYEGPDETGLFFNWEYFNEAMNNWNYCGFYIIKVASGDLAPRVAESVDALFQNTTAPTKTESEKAFVLGFISMLGNVQLLITSICSGVIFAIVLVAANTMAMSIRERTREIGILKALGFRRHQVLFLLLSEAIVITLGGSLIGSWGARLLYSSIDPSQVTAGFLQRFYVTPQTLALCALIGLGVGLVSAGIPAWQAARRPVVDALRRIV